MQKLCAAMRNYAQLLQPAQALTRAAALGQRELDDENLALPLRSSSRWQAQG